MKCIEVQKKLSAYVDRELDPGQQKRVGNHIQQCPRCLKEHQLLLRTDACLRGLPQEEPSRASCQRLFQELGSLYLPAAGERVQRPSVWSRAAELIVVLLGHRKGPWTMDAFDDFPPWSLGHAYMKLIHNNL